MKNKRVAITGASQGIGLAISEVFSEADADVFLLSRNEIKLINNSEKLNAKYFVLDVSNESAVKNIFSKIGDVDILINNAGICHTASILEMSTNGWKEHLDINLNGTMYCTREVIPSMIKNKFGRIINISSISGKVGDAFYSAYCASKFAMVGFTQSVAKEISRKNITANCICPGWVETDMAEDILSDGKYAQLLGMDKDKLKTSSLESVPIGRYIHPREVAYLALYLASDFASAITGQSLIIDGGLCTI